MVVRLQSPDVPESSFAAKPKTSYRAGSGYCRVEELPDEERGIHGLVIINEPDIWVVNLLAKAARHYLDPGPKFNCRLLMFASLEDAKAAKNPTTPAFELEFGQELAYFKAKGAVPEQGPILQGKPTRSYSVTSGGLQFLLFTTGAPERPWAIVRQRGNARDIYWYIAYEQLPFDPKLFSRPKDVKMEEQ